MTDDLVAFLRARLDEDEKLARGAEGGKGARGYFAVTGWCYFDEDWGDILQSQLVNDSDAWKPARVLADVESKRRTIDEIVPLVEQYDTQISNEWGESEDGTADKLLRLFALPYTGHPDYREEWRP